MVIVTDGPYGEWIFGMWYLWQVLWVKNREKPDDYSSECECRGNLTYTRTLEFDEEDSDEDLFDSPTLIGWANLEICKGFVLCLVQSYAWF